MTGGRIILPPTNPSLDSNGNPVSGSTLTYYQNGTTTPVSIYSDKALTVPLANPLTSDSAGVFPQVWASNAAGYSVKWTRTGFSDVTFNDIFPDLDSSAVGTYVSLNQSQVSLGTNVTTAFGTVGVGLIENAFTQTDSTTGAGTVATAYASVVNAVTFATPANAITITNAYGLYLKDPVAGSHVTLTNKYALGVDSLRVVGAVSIGGILSAGSISSPVINGTVSGTAISDPSADHLVGVKTGNLSIAAGGSASITTQNGTMGFILFFEQQSAGSSGNRILYNNNAHFVGVGTLDQAISSGITKIVSVVGDAGGTDHVTITVGSGGGTVTINYKIVPFTN